MDVDELLDKFTAEVHRQVESTRSLVAEMQAEARKVIDWWDRVPSATSLTLNYPDSTSGDLIIRNIIGNCGPGAGTLYIGRRRFPVNGVINIPGPMRIKHNDRVQLFSGDDVGDNITGSGAAGELFLELMGQFAPRVPTLLQ